jgi:tetratricopeptide (TPR) repeat protein
MTIRSFLIHSAAMVLAVVAIASPCLAGTNDQFAKANQEYADGKFKEAVADYESLVQSADWSAALFYNLGNAYFRTADFGKAILNYERALALEPNHPEAQANLRIARDEARALELAPAWTDRIMQSATVTQLSVAAAVLFWGGAFLFTFFLFSKRRRRGGLALAFCCLIGAAALLVALLALERGPRGNGLAIVTAPEINARLATADTASTVLALPAGSEIKVEQQRGDWVYALLPNSLHGWLPASATQPVRL